MQGMGLFCLEELQWGDKQHSWIKPGQLFTRGPGTYKIPTSNDIPIDFRVSLLTDAPNARAVHSSKVRLALQVAVVKIRRPVAKASRQERRSIGVCVGSRLGQ